MESKPTTECGAEFCPKCALKRDGDCIGPAPEQPTTGEIVQALKICAGGHGCHPKCIYFEDQGGCQDRISIVAADRLESQERSIEEAAKLNEKQANTIATLTARAEQAEKERDAAVKDMRFLDRCKTCSHARTRHLQNSECKTCKALSNFKWRGLPQEGEGL